MDVSQAREIIKDVLEEVRIEKDEDLEGFYWIEYNFKNLLKTYNRKINMVAGARPQTDFNFTYSKRERFFIKSG